MATSRGRKRSPGARAVAALVPVALLLGALSREAGALSRLVRRYDERDGLNVSEIVELAQDARGFVWVGTVGGLVRFDGTAMRPWASDSLRHVVRFIACAPDGEVVTAGLGEPLWRLTESGAEAVRSAHGARITDWVHAAFARDGALWVASADTLWRRDPGGAWHAWAASAFDGGPLRRVLPDEGGRVFVATAHALWSLGPAGPPARISGVTRVEYAARCGGGIAALTSDGRLYGIANGRDSLWWAGTSHGRGFAVRGDVVWASIDQYVIAFRPGHRPEIVAPKPGMPTGRPLLVDREGTLWLGSYQGLLAMPEPGTLIRDERDGLPSPAHMHAVARNAEGVWLMSWYGAVRVGLGRMDSMATPIGSYAGRFVIDARGRLWNAELERGFIRWQGTRPVRYARPGLHGLYGSSPRRDGSTWLATDDGPFLVPAGEGAPRRVAGAAPPTLADGWEDCDMGPILEDRHGRLWLTIDEDVWSANADSLVRGARVAWRREPIPGSDGGTELAELPDGELWLGTANAGVLRHGPRGWTPLPGNRQLASLRIYGIRPSPSGGVWVLAVGSLVRVAPDPRAEAGWRIVERLRAWQGVPTQQAGDIAEDRDGRLWLATLSGLIEVPPEARHSQLEPPRIEPVDLRVDGRRLALDRPVALPSRRNRLELRFAALSFRDRSQLRYQVRLRPSDPWVDCAEPTFQFADLSPGSYMAELRASLDGVRWTDPPTHVAFTVARPWYLTGWAMALAMGLLGAALLGAHRLRVAFLLGLERQRTRIAMDLHDEMGSGLGSIGILAGLAAEESLDEASRLSLARRIATTAGELGGALSDIVRSLRRGEDTLEAFALGLVERGRRLLPSETPTLEVQLPERWPAVRLAPQTQRQLMLIAVEALHNAARHAGARTVRLALAPEGDHWLLRVADDGRGLAASAPGHAGNGLGNMRARAAGLGARVTWASADGGGTVVELRFDPGARPARNGLA